MAKPIVLKGFFTEILPIKAVTEKLNIQDVIFKVPAYVNAFQEIQGSDEYWPISIIGDDKIKTFAILDEVAKLTEGFLKAEIAVYVNAKTWYKKEDVNKESPMYSLYAVLSDCKYL